MKHEPSTDYLKNSKMLRLDGETHAKLKRLASEDRRTMATVIRKALSSYEAAR